MSQQQHPRLRPVDFPMFPSRAESSTHDKKTADGAAAGIQVQTDVHSVIRSDKEDIEGSAAVRCEP